LTWLVWVLVWCGVSAEASPLGEGKRVAHVTELSDVTHPTWAAFMGDPRHTGFCDLDLPGPVPRAAWRFRPGNHVWA